MTRTVDLVVVGSHRSARDAALDAAQRGLRVLVVIRATRGRSGARLRDALRKAGHGLRRRVSVMTGAEVVCVDGVRSVEAVVVRRVRTGRLVAFNASAIVTAERRAR